MTMHINQKRAVRSRFRSNALLGLLAVCSLSPFSSLQADDWRYSGVDRIVAFGDVHGAYDALVETLQKADVLDEELAWSGGKAHLVSTGDLLDRGADSRKVMDLMRRLEREARRAGGRVHQLLGNHEVMNLVGDLRYVADEEFAAYLDLETESERESWYKRFFGSKPEESDESAVRDEFNKLAPPGFFGHRRAFRSYGVYGKWLLSKPFMVVINGIAFTHGGAPPYVAEYGLSGVNDTLKRDLIEYVKTSTLLVDEGVLSPVDGFKKIPQLLFRLSETGELAEKYKTAAQRAIDLSRSPIHRAAGPTWYRGTATCNELVEGDALDSALRTIGASRIVVGHTITDSHRVQQSMDGRVIKIDTGMLAKLYDGSGNALIIENGTMAVVNQHADDTYLPEEPPIRVGLDALEIEEAVLADILANGSLAELDIYDEAWKLARVTQDDKTVFAYFREQRGPGNFMPEIAAYRLDRLLRLGMVPVTVRRQVAGRPGTLQFIPPVTLTEFERVAVGPQWQEDCPLEKQFAAMSVFDALLHNAARTPSTMLYDPDDLLLILVNHENSFAIEEGIPASLSGADLAIGAGWRTALQKLDDSVLRTELGDVLDDAQLRALGKRRDALIRQRN